MLPNQPSRMSGISSHQTHAAQPALQNDGIFSHQNHATQPVLQNDGDLLPPEPPKMTLIHSQAFQENGWQSGRKLWRSASLEINRNWQENYKKCHKQSVCTVHLWDISLFLVYHYHYYGISSSLCLPLSPHSSQEVSVTKLKLDISVCMTYTTLWCQDEIQL